MNNDVIKVQLSCGVDYYKGDKGDKPIKGVDYFTQEDIADIVEQIETGGVDLDGYATKEYVDNAVSGVVVSETDPTVPAWAKQANKPSYTASEVGALPADTQLFSGNYNDLRNKPTIPTVPANVSAFNNDAGYLTEHQSLSGYATKAYVDEAIENIDTSGGITVETDPTVPSWAKQANKPTYTAQEVGALPANTELFSGDYNDLSNKPTLPPAPIVIQTTIAGQPSVVDGVYTLPLTITSNNMAEAYAQYQTHPSTVGMAVDLTALGRATKMYLDCESFYRYGNDSSGYTYETFGEFNDNSLSQSFGYEFMNVNVHLNTGGSGSRGTVVGLSTVNQLASKANSADLATVATSGDYNDLTNKPTIPTAYTLPTATTSTLGGVKVDGSTITIDGNGVISSSGGSSYTFTNGLTERDGTVSWNLNSRIRAGSGSDSVVIGNNNTASGYYAFAQGSGNQANGIASHAEGNTTRAWGPYSHAEGSNIIASGSHQHAEGKYNVEDSNSIFQNIAGNGSSSARATMFARDWNGNEYLSGNLFVGCNDFTTTANGLTTANAGGGKVATESYVDTAIANIPSSGGSSYTAGQGISIDNGEISLDFGNEIEDGGFCFTQHYDNKDYYKYTTDMSPNEINLTSYGEADPETGDQETKSILITGEGITFDYTGDTHTLGVSNGELVFDNSPIGSGGGSSYTAGNGIEIDSNGVITNTKPNLNCLLPLSSNSVLTQIQFRGKSVFLPQNKDDLLTALKNGYLVIPQSNIKITQLELMGEETNIPFVDFTSAITNGTYKITSIENITNHTFASGMIYYFDGNALYKGVGYYGNSCISIKLGSRFTTLGKELTDINTRIPTAPSTDGDYVLKVSVSSGTPTYSWVAET